MSQAARRQSDTAATDGRQQGCEEGRCARTSTLFCWRTSRTSCSEKATKKKTSAALSGLVCDGIGSAHTKLEDAQEDLVPHIHLARPNQLPSPPQLSPSERTFLTLRSAPIRLYTCHPNSR